MTNPPPLQPATFKDQSTGLVIFGILTILGGVLAALLLVFTSLTLLLPARPGVPPQNIRMLLPALSMYGVASIILTWLGIGSIMKRRWAHALLVVGSWSGLVAGVLGTVILTLSLSSLKENLAASLPQGDSSIVWFSLIIMFGTTMVMYLIIPGIWASFYSRRQVRMTCEYYDQVSRWTDRCPLPVLAVALWLGVSVISLVMMAVGNMAIIPFFGMFLHGGVGIAASAVLALICIYAARKIYLLDMQGWWIALAFIVLFTISAAITYSRHDFMEIYQYMNFPPEQLAAIEKFSFFKGSYIYLTIFGWVVPALAYLFWIRKYFRLSHPA